MSHPPSHSHSFSLSAADCLALVTGVFQAHFPGHDTVFLQAAFGAVEKFFAGHYPGYQACDSAYHNFDHTNVACAAVARILDGHIKSGAAPKITARDYELTIAAILLHDTGYIKKTGDFEGTGAKYTVVHPSRSVEFASVMLTQLAAGPTEIAMVQAAIRFAGTEEGQELPALAARDRFIGSVVGAGDILGQMATPDYPDQLPKLYREFREGAAFAGLRGTGIARYQSATDLMQRTREFYQTYLDKLLNGRWGRVHEVLRYHFADGRNYYLEAIARNLDRIDELVRKQK